MTILVAQRIAQWIGSGGPGKTNLRNNLFWIETGLDILGSGPDFFCLDTTGNCLVWDQMIGKVVRHIEQFYNIYNK